MKKGLLLILFSLTFSAQATELVKFTDIVNAIIHGRQLTAVFSLKECRADFPLRDIITSTKLDMLIVLDDKRITASTRHFSFNDPQLLDILKQSAPQLTDIPGFEYINYDIHKNGKVYIKTTLLLAIDNSKVTESSIRCELGHGFSVFDQF